MSKLKFSDGVEIDTSRELHPLHLRDGWYVVGKGLLFQVESEQEALETIAGILETIAEMLKRGD